MQFESWNTCIRNTAHQNRTKRLHSIPVDLSMPQAHTELDRLRLCQCKATDLRGFHLQNPPFLCMLMCLCTQWWQGCTWQSMCAVVWISVYRRMNMCVCVYVLISECVHLLHPWLSDFAHYPLLLFLCWKTAGTILSLVFSTSSSFPCLTLIFFLPSPLFLSAYTVYISPYFPPNSASVSVTHKHAAHIMLWAVKLTPMCVQGWKETENRF